MTETTIATADKAPPAPDDLKVRTLPVIDPAAVVVDHEGFARRHVVVRLPAGAIADDLKERTLWHRVQKSSKAIKQHDALYLIAYDQSWVTEAVASYGDVDGVDLAGIRIIQTPQRITRLFADNTYAVRWSGTGYFVERLADGHKMTATVASPQLAERDLRQLYPSRMGR